MLDDEAARGLRQGADAADALTARLEAGGFVAAREEALELLAAAGEDGEGRADPGRLEELVRRRETGEPLAWITGRVAFGGLELRVEPGVYVPRFQTELLADRAAAALPDAGVAIDLCTGCGAIAAVLARAGAARVVASDLSEAAVACARANGVEAYAGDLFDPLPPVGADVITAVVPYVPTLELPLLQRDTLTHESPQSYDGGADGLDIARRVVAEAPGWLKPGGTLLLELGGDQAAQLDLPGFDPPETLVDEDGDARGIIARRLIRGPGPLINSPHSAPERG